MVVSHQKARIDLGDWFDLLLAIFRPLIQTSTRRQETLE